MTSSRSGGSIRDATLRRNMATSRVVFGESPMMQSKHGRQAEPLHKPFVCLFRCGSPERASSGACGVASSGRSSSGRRAPPDASTAKSRRSPSAQDARPLGRGRMPHRSSTRPDGLLTRSHGTSTRARARCEPLWRSLRFMILGSAQDRANALRGAAGHGAGPREQRRPPRRAPCIRSPGARCHMHGRDNVGQLASESCFLRGLRLQRAEGDTSSMPVSLQQQVPSLCLTCNAAEQTSQCTSCIASRGQVADRGGPGGGQAIAQKGLLPKLEEHCIRKRTWENPAARPPDIRRRGNWAAPREGKPPRRRPRCCGGPITCAGANI